MQKLSDWVRHRSETAAGLIGLVTAFLRSTHAAAPATVERAGAQVRQRVTRLTIVWLLALGTVAVIDFATRPRLGFAPFYLLLSALAAWSCGRGIGMFIVIGSVAVLLVRELTDHSVAGGRFWQIGLFAVLFVVVVTAVSSVREAMERLERRARERTRALDHEVSDRRQTEEQLRKTMQQFRQMAENISDAFWMRDAREARMAYVSPAYENIWGRTCRELYQFPQRWLEAIHPEDRARVAEAMYTRQAAGEYSQEYRIVRPDGTLRWIRDRAYPIRDSAGNVVRIVGIAEDITERRRLEREILEISDREQARMGQDLHDGLCQKLVSIAFDHNSLEQQLAVRGQPEASAVQQIGSVLDDAITEARAMARGLFPVQLETNGLSLALEQLAAAVNARARVNCRVDCSHAVPLRDNAVATHLYRIAQEAVNNALKHGNAQTVSIRLVGEGDWIELTVTDDGVGISEDSRSEGGMGMHIMNYRARTIGGTLAISPGPEGGTVVSCSVRQAAG